MAKSIDILVEQQVLTKEAVARLKASWIRTCDELYSRILACNFSTNSEPMKVTMEKELGLDKGKLGEFQNYIAEYVSPNVLSAKKPGSYPLGLRT